MCYVKCKKINVIYVNGDILFIIPSDEIYVAIVLTVFCINIMYYALDKILYIFFLNKII